MSQLKNEIEVAKRKQELKNKLINLEIYQTNDGRKLNDVSLYTLEWTYITAMNDKAKAYGDS